MNIKPHIHVPYDKIAEHLDFIKTSRFNLEIYFGSSTVSSITKNDIKSLKALLDYNPVLSFHAPFMDLSPGAVDPDIRRVTLQRFHQMLDFAEIINPVTIVFHSGYEKWKYALQIEPWLTNSIGLWKEINSRAYDTGVKIAIENIFEEEPANLRMLIEEMNSDNFGICFDTGHFNLFSTKSLEHWIDNIGKYIVELHIHDNDKSSDQHRPIGYGSFDFERFFRLISPIKPVHTIEAHTPEDVVIGIQRLDSLLAVL
ncbi:MAG: sugar phosphate isomerase/epimerase family protein [Dissulfurispiraceae bacterium]|jgi:sugar phosphate isomerase/epimerase|nr:sugar phosphate isomerase/epimerase family protein [Dissulfurispiraceae bacterium]